MHLLFNFKILNCNSKYCSTRNFNSGIFNKLQGFLAETFLQNVLRGLNYLVERSKTMLQTLKKFWNNENYN